MRVERLYISQQSEFNLKESCKKKNTKLLLHTQVVPSVVSSSDNLAR
jgi:hypothetical protein